ncbi:MAG: adenine nucleotide alpha hydrolase [Flavobacteriales bacterium]|nr:adenine nucleotide alpha hydrolase [Flavobacteriales bacterium]
MPNSTHKTFFNWSSGKDAALALFKLQQNPDYNVSLLFTTVNEHFKRVSMHGLRTELLDLQVKELGLPLVKMFLPKAPSMEAYEMAIKTQLKTFSDAGYVSSAYGDIFLEDLRLYRDDLMKPYNISGVYPLWQTETSVLIEEFIELGFKAKIICLNAELLHESFLGRTIDKQFLKDLPSHVDPCGENGEFHTFCYDGPIFRNPVSFEIGERQLRSYKDPKVADKEIRFWFLDLMPGNA